MRADPARQPARWRREREKSHAAMVTEEHRLRRAIEAAVLLAILAGADVGGSLTARTRHVRRLMALAVADALWRGSTSARVAGAQSLRRELRDLRVSHGLGLMATGAVFAIARESKAASAVLGRRVARAWSERVAAVDVDVMRAPRPSTIMRAGARDVGAYLDTVVITENAAAFNAGRAAALAGATSAEAVEAVEAAADRLMLAESLARSGTGLAYFEVWDATMDSRTCDQCVGLNGLVRPVGKPFPDGPPPAHARCRCSLGLLLLPDGYDWASD